MGDNKDLKVNLPPLPNDLGTERNLEFMSEEVFVEGYLKGIKDAFQSIGYDHGTVTDVIKQVEKLRLWILETYKEEQEVKEEATKEIDYQKIPVYTGSLRTAIENDRVAEYDESMYANRNCKKAIEDAIKTNVKGNKLKRTVFEDVVEKFGQQRVAYILANMIDCNKTNYTIENQQWAEQTGFLQKDKLSTLYEINRQSEFGIENSAPVLNTVTKLFRQQYADVQKETNKKAKKLSNSKRKESIEKEIFNSKENIFLIYQLKDVEETRFLRFEPMRRLAREGIAVEKKNYDLIYKAPLKEGVGLEDIYTKFNIDHPADYTGHSLSVSDIVVLCKNGEITSHYVDSIGFVDVPEFTNELKNSNKEVTLTVAECSEFHSLGEYYENIKSVKQAIELFNDIPSERRNGIKSIGINIHTNDKESYQDIQTDIVIGDQISLEILDYIPEITSNVKAMEMIKELIKELPYMEVNGSLEKWTKNTTSVSNETPKKTNQKAKENSTKKRKEKDEMSL